MRDGRKYRKNGYTVIHDTNRDISSADWLIMERLGYTADSPNNYNGKASAMIVEDVMTTSLKTVSPDTPMSEVVTMMCLFRLSGIPVVEDDNMLVGMIAERDVLDPLFPTLEDMLDGTAPAMDIATALSKYGDVTGKKVSDLMTRNVITVSPNMQILKAAARMVGKRFRRIPVAVGDRLVGMLSLGDVHKALYREHAKKKL